MRLLLSVLVIGFVCVSATASDVTSKSVQTLSEESVQAANGVYNLKSVCISASNYSEIKAREFCMDDAHTISMLSTDRVMVSSSCNPDGYPSRCSEINSYILRTRMSVY